MTYLNRWVAPRVGLTELLWWPQCNDLPQQVSGHRGVGLIVAMVTTVSWPTSTGEWPQRGGTDWVAMVTTVPWPTSTGEWPQRGGTDWVAMVTTVPWPTSTGEWPQRGGTDSCYGDQCHDLPQQVSGHRGVGLMSCYGDHSARSYLNRWVATEGCACSLLW